MKVNRFDSTKQISSIQDELVSQSNIRQRIGRAGRVQAGEYFSMISSKVKRSLPHSITSEIQRSDLQSTVLNLKSMLLDATLILATTPEPPLSLKVIDSLVKLEGIGAIDNNGDLTTKGIIMAKLPMSPWISNLIIQGIIYKCLDPLLTIAAIISSDRSPFSMDPAQMSETRQFIRKNYAGDSNSDQITSLNAIISIFNTHEHVDRLHHSEFDRLFLKKSAVLNIQKAMSQYYDILEQTGIYSQRSDYSFNLYSKNTEYVKSIFGKCLYPNIGRLNAKNVYKGKAHRSMRLTGGSVNSYSAQCEENENLNEDLLESEVSDIILKDTPQVTELDQKHKFEVDLIDRYVWNFSLVPQPRATSTPIFPQLLMYQELHQIESTCFMRNTSEISPLAFLLLTPSRISNNSGNMNRESKKMIVDGWLDLELMGKTGITVNEFRVALEKYEGFVIEELQKSGGSDSVDGSELHCALNIILE